VVEINIVDRIRDIEQGQNTLMTVDELLPLGLNILVFRDDVPTNPNRTSFFDHEDDDELTISRYTIVDEKWISTQALGLNADDEPLKKAYETASSSYFAFNMGSYNHENQVELMKMLDESGRLRSEYRKREDEYIQFRPSVLTEQIKSKDLVIVSRSLVDKVKEEIPEAKIAILEEASVGKFQLRVPVTQEDNYPRILVRASAIVV